MKKQYVLVIISAMAVALAACGTSKETAVSSSREEKTATTSAETSSEGADEEGSDELEETATAAYYGMWYNVDSSLAELVLSEGSMEFRGTPYEITEILTTEDGLTLYTDVVEEDGLCYEITLLDPDHSTLNCRTISLYRVDREDPDAYIMEGYFVDDLKYTNGSLAETADENDADVTSPEAATIKTTETFYLLKEVEDSDGSLQEKEAFSDQEFALIYDTRSSCINGMMFTDSETNTYRIMSEGGVMQLELSLTGDDGKTEDVLLPMIFNDEAHTLTLDFSDTGYNIRKMIFTAVEKDEFFSGNREALLDLY